MRDTRRVAALERLGGVVVLPGVLRPAAPPAAAPPVRLVPDPAAPAAVPPRAAPPRRGPAFVPKVRALDLSPTALEPFGELPGRVAGCADCALAATRTLTVFGEGDPHADLVLCGEAPGYEEDRSGRPFVGKAGVLLTAMIEKGLRMRREDVFVLNTVKCRPPQNRDPSLEEIAACRAHLSQQLSVIAPRVIVALGNAAVRSLLGDTTPISILRGRVVTAFGAQVVPTYHPAYLLRNVAAKRQAWEDLKKVLRLLDQG